MEWEPRELPENNVTDVHPLRELATLVAGIVAVAAVATLVVAFTVDVAVRALPASWEARLFGDLFQGQATVADDPRRAAAAALLDRLDQVGEESPYTFHLFVIDQGEPNAFAFPGGAVGVTTGLLERVESENELAFVLAHELGHFAGRHHLRGISRSVAVALVMGAIFGVGDDALPAFVSSLTELGFGREHEREADRFALERLAAHYGHVAGASDFFGRLPDADGDGALARGAAWLSTHPTSPDRVAAVTRFARERGWRVRGPLTPLAPEFRAE